MLGQAQTRARDAGSVDLASRVVRAALLPAADRLAIGWDATSDFLDGVAGAGALKRRVRELESQAGAVADYTGQMDRMSAELDDLRKLAGFAAASGKTKVPTRITAIFAYDNRATIDAGSLQGVAPDMPVVSGRGLLGVVQTVEPNHAEILLVSSPALKLGAIDLRNPPPAGLLHGEGSSKLVVEFLDPNAPAQDGDEIVTSGFSERIPRGIPIGRIVQIDDNPDFGTRRAVVYPWAVLGAARDVYVLK